jgi:hypothetical protein
MLINIMARDEWGESESFKPKSRVSKNSGNNRKKVKLKAHKRKQKTVNSEQEEDLEFDNEFVEETSEELIESVEEPDEELDEEPEEATPEKRKKREKSDSKETLEDDESMQEHKKPKEKARNTRQKKEQHKKSKSKKKSDKSKPTDSRTESKEWKQQARKYKSTKRRTKVLGLLIIIFIIIATILGYIYFFKIDTDGDGIPDSRDDDDDDDIMKDWWEKRYGLDPKSPDDAFKDLDGDGLKNVDEFKFNSNPSKKDTDGDRLLDSDEFELRNLYGKSTDPNSEDSEHDGMDDYWEWMHGLNPVKNDANSDADKDGFDANHNGKLEPHEYYTNLDEYINKTDPKDMDSDNDGMHDGWEMYYKEFIFLNPNDPKDGNGDDDFTIESDGSITYSPDGLTNLQEFLNGTDPTKPDTDGDTLTDYEEVVLYNTDPLEWDSDDDGLWDGWEVGYGGAPVGLDPNSEDTDNNGVTDRFEDLDDDELDNNREYQHGTSPVDKDSDDDGMDDGWEVLNNCMRPVIIDNSSDVDGDLLLNLAEYENRTDPCKPDTDGDGLTDGEELVLGFHGLLINGVYQNKSSLPRYFTNATNNDTDGDDILDGEEVNSGWNASDPDTDSDGISDLEEINIHKTNPAKQDTDNDRLSDWEEVNVGDDGYLTFPTNHDSDGDGLSDGDEVLTDFLPFTIELNNADPTNNDTDSDGMEDGFEGLLGKTSNRTVIANFDLRYGTNFITDLQNHREVTEVWLVNPLNASDRNMDADYDGFDWSDEGILNDYEEFTNIQEFKWGTSPVLWDHDGDGMSDGWESGHYEFSTFLNLWTPDPLIKDGHLDSEPDWIEYFVDNVSYIDKFTNLEEFQTGEDLNNDGIIDHGTTFPNDRDTDNDARDDYFEIWTNDADNDGLYDGWELIFNGTSKNPNDFIPNDISLSEGKFNPHDNNSDNMGVDDWEDDYDGDSWNNKKEHGDPLHRPGSSDPTDETETPLTILESRRSSRIGPNLNDKSSRKSRGSSTRIESNDQIIPLSNIYTENIYEKYLITNSYLRILYYIPYGNSAISPRLLGCIRVA